MTIVLSQQTELFILSHCSFLQSLHYQVLGKGRGGGGRGLEVLHSQAPKIASLHPGPIVWLAEAIHHSRLVDVTSTDTFSDQPGPAWMYRFLVCSWAYFDRFHIILRP